MLILFMKKVFGYFGSGKAKKSSKTSWKAVGIIVAIIATVTAVCLTIMRVIQKAFFNFGKAFDLSSEPVDDENFEDEEIETDPTEEGC